MKKIGIVANLKKKNAKSIVKELSRWLVKKGKTVILDEESAAGIKGKNRPLSIQKIASQADLLISLGGDGTLLRVGRVKNIDRVPILGVNLGGLGFITEIGYSEIYKELTKILAGNFKTEERMRLDVKIAKKGRKETKFIVLNELVLAKRSIARLLHLEIFIDRNYVTTYQADGLIVSTPTGSTGHSLSAGGPIMEASLEGIILTPICPHTLANRPLIIPANKEVQVKTKPVTRTRDVCATMDGQVVVNLSVDETVSIKKAPAKLKLIVSPRRNYYQVLREKLCWGERGHSSYA